MIKETRLDNGLQVLTKEDHHQSIVTCMVWYRMGSRHESLGYTGISHFIEHMMFKGTDTYAKGDIDRLTLQNGGYNNAYTWIDATTYHFSFASDRWEQALEIEANRMQNCLFDPEEVAAEKQVILEEWQSANDDPEENLMELVNCTALNLHPYRYPILGWKQDIENMTSEMLHDFYSRYYHPGNATLVIVGDFDTPQVLEKIEALFSDLPIAEKLPEPLYEEPPQKGERRVVLKDPQIQAPRLCYAYHAPSIFSEDFYALTLIEYLLSEGKTSLIYKRMVEELEYATSIDVSFYATYAPFLFSINLDICEGQKLSKVERSLDQIINQLRKGKLRSRQLQKALNQIEADFYFNQETTEEQAETIGESASLGDWTLSESYLDKIRAVTVEQVLQVAQTYLDPEKRTVGWLLPDTYDSKSSRLKLLAGKARKRKKAAYTPPEQNHSKHESLLQMPAVPQFTSKEFTTDSGMRLQAIEHNKTPTVCVKLWIHGGYTHDPDDKLGLHYLFGDLLLRGGDTFEQIDFMGAQLDVSCVSTGIVFTLEMLSRDTTKALELLINLLQNPNFSEKELKKARLMLSNELLQAEARPHYQMAIKLNQVMYAKTPLAHPSTGYKSTLKQIQRKDLDALTESELNPHNIHLSISGDISSEKVFETLNQLTQNWDNKSPKVPSIELPEKGIGLSSHYPLDFPSKEQVCLYLTHPGIARTHVDYPALLALDLIFGISPGFTARIPQLIRDELGLAYTIEASIAQTAGLFPGLFVVYTETAPEHVPQLISEVKKEMVRLQNDGVTETELSDIQRFFSGNYVFRFETNDQLASSLVQQALFGWDDQAAKNLLNDIVKLTPEDIQRVAQAHLKPDSLQLFYAGPQDKIPSLESALK